MIQVNKPEVRLIPEKTNRKFFMEHLKPYVYLKYKAKGAKILEIGCGDGYGANYLSQFADKIIAIDYVQMAVDRAGEKYKAANLEFRCMDATNLEFADNSFDLVCSFQVIEHIPESKLITYLS